MIELLKPLWQPVIRFIRSYPAREAEFQRKHAEAYPETSAYAEHEALDRPPPVVPGLFTRK